MSKQNNFRLLVAADYNAMSHSAARFIEAHLMLKPDLLLCASAGGTPTGTYQLLAARHAKNPELFRKLRILQIDEWGGLAPGHPASCRADLTKKLTGPVRLSPGRFISFKGDAANRGSECGRIARWLAANGPIDICLLGLGLNGHVAMNEPADVLQAGVHVARLLPKTVNHGMLKDLRSKPKYGFTLGMGDILRSRKILMIVSGPSKRAILKRSIEGRISTGLPASFLRLHSDVTIICDRAACR